MDKHFGFYRGKVTNNQDPENRMRVKLLVPQILGTEETEWAWPCLPLNWSAKPSAIIKAHDPHTHTYTDTSDAGTASLVTGSTVLTNNHILIDLVPKIGTGVWVTFEGGDINHPIWMGVWS